MKTFITAFISQGLMLLTLTGASAAARPTHVVCLSKSNHDVFLSFPLGINGNGNGSTSYLSQHEITVTAQEFTISRILIKDLNWSEEFQIEITSNEVHGTMSSGGDSANAEAKSARLVNGFGDLRLTHSKAKSVLEASASVRYLRLDFEMKSHFEPKSVIAVSCQLTPKF